MQQLRHRSHATAAGTTTIPRVEGDNPHLTAANHDAVHDTTTNIPTTTDNGKEPQRYYNYHYWGWFWNNRANPQQQYRLPYDDSTTRRLRMMIMITPGCGGGGVRFNHTATYCCPITRGWILPYSPRGTMVAVITMTVSILMLLIVVMWNEDSIGMYVDDYLRQRYHGQILLQQQKAFRHPSRRRSLFPDVTIKATRKVERAHYSYYLYEILQHYQHQQNDNTTTANLSRDPPIFAYSGRRQNVPSSSTTTLSSVIEIDGLPQIVVPNRLHRQVMPASPFHRLQWWDWFCDRCLRTGYGGSYPRCRAVCSWKHLQQMYFPNALQSSVGPKKSTINTTPGASIAVSYRSDTPVPATIPRIIHQAWNDRITTLEYPELARIRNTYRSMTGYEYYFYDDALQIQFLQDHYPPGVVQMYESITSADQRYSMFSLLVLYKMGGVYANVDVVLEVHLDSLLFERERDMEDDDEISLIVVRNPNIIQAHCTFNVLIAAVPGHPVIGSMIEAALQSFLTLATLQTTTSKLLPTHIWPTYFNDVTTRDEISKVPIWKLHSASASSAASVNDYIYGGNCAWGRTINRATTRRNPNDFLLADLNVWGLTHLGPWDHENETTTRNGSVKILMVRSFFPEPYNQSFAPSIGSSFVIVEIFRHLTYLYIYIHVGK